MRGFVRKRGSTNTWYFDVPDPVTGKRRQYSKGGFRTKRECQQVLTEALASLRTGTFVEPSHRTVAGFLVEEWLPAMRPPRVRPSTWLSYQRNIGRHIVPAFGHLPLQRLTPAQLTAFYRGRLETGIGMEGAAWRRRQSATSMAPCMPRSGTRCAGGMSPQCRRGGRSPQGDGAGDACLEPGAAPRLPRSCPRRPAVRRLVAARHHRHAKGRGGRTPLVRRRPGSRTRLTPPTSRGRQPPGPGFRAEDGKGPPLDRSRPGHRGRPP
jgi:hypothetical protein